MCAECVWAKSSQSAAGWHTFAAAARAGRWSRQLRNRCRQPNALKVARPVWPGVCCSHTRTSNRNGRQHSLASAVWRTVAAPAMRTCWFTTSGAVCHCSTKGRVKWISCI